MTAQKRSMQDRRSGKDRRRFSRLKKFIIGAPERRDTVERRIAPERRNGWVRLTKWSSVYLKELKISKFLEKNN